MDRDLVARVRAGDVAAYRELVEKYKNTVYGLAISHVGDFDLAEDLAQEAFIRGFYRLDSLKDPNRFKAWLTSIVSNLCLIEHRRRAAARSSAIQLDPSYDLDQETGLEKERELRQLERALDRLTQNDRDSIVLYYLEGKRIQNVAEFLGVSTSAVKGRLYRARRKLRKEMTEMAKKKLAERRLDEAFADRVDIRTFGDWALLDDKEIQHTLRKTNTADLGRALKAEGEDVRAVENRVMANISDRVQAFVREIIADESISESQAVSAQKKILHMIHRLQVLGIIRPPVKGFTSKQYEKAVREVAEILIEENRHGLRWMPGSDEVLDLMPYLAMVIRDEGIEAAKEAFRGIAEPAFTQGLWHLARDIPRDQAIADLKEISDHAVSHTRLKCNMIIEGMTAIIDGKQPKEVAEVVMKA